MCLPGSPEVRADILKLFGIYFLCHFFILINFQGIYWDDWVIYNVDRVTILSLFEMAGSKLFGYIHGYILPVGNGVLVYRVLVFMLYFVTGVLFYIILKDHIFKKDSSAFFVALIYLTLPVNSAKIALINFPATLLYFVFVSAFYLLSVSLKRDLSIVLRLFILSLFFISFHLNSLLVFYALVLLYIIYSTYMSLDASDNASLILKTVKVFILSYSDYIILPLVFYLYKVKYLAQYGLYANYNIIKFDFAAILDLIVDSVSSSFYDVMLLSLSSAVKHIFLLLFIFSIIFYVIKNKYIHLQKYSVYIIYFLSGLFFFLLSVFPYAVVNKLPQLSGWESRHQILMPLGISFVIYSAIMFFFGSSKYVKTLVITFLITTFTMQNISNGYYYLKDWYYQVSLEENFKSSRLVNNHTTFVINVELSNSLANNRNFRFYELNGLLKKSFGHDGKLMTLESGDIQKYKKYKKYKQYNFSSWVEGEPVYLRVFDEPDFEFNAYTMIKLLYYQTVNDSIFRNIAKSLVRIEAITVEDAS